MKTRRLIKRSQSKRSQSKRSQSKRSHSKRTIKKYRKTRSIKKIKHWRNKTLKGGEPPDSEGELNTAIEQRNSAIKRFVVKQNPTYETAVNYPSQIPLYVGSPEKQYNSAELYKKAKYDDDIKNLIKLDQVDPNRIYQPFDRIDPYDPDPLNKRDYQLQIKEVLEQIQKEINKINERRNFLIKKIKDKKAEEDKLLSKLFNPYKKPTNKEKITINTEMKAAQNELNKAEANRIEHDKKLNELEEEYKEYENLGLNHSDPTIKVNLNMEDINRDSIYKKSESRSESRRKNQSSNKALYASQVKGEEDTYVNI